MSGGIGVKIPAHLILVADTKHIDDLLDGNECGADTCEDRLTSSSSLRWVIFAMNVRREPDAVEAR